MEKYGKLTILRVVKKDNKHKFVECLCDCGNKKIINYSNIKRGLVKSCGCMVKTKQGLSNTRIGKCYHGIEQRCYNPKDMNYKNYGGRGIKMCDEWKTNFMSFYNWAIKNGYKDNLTIDRIDNDKGYCPENCRWVDMQTQQNHRRNNRNLTFNGKTLTITQWAKKYNMSYRNLFYRLKNGYSLEKALTKPLRNTGKPVAKGWNKPKDNKPYFNQRWRQ